MSLLGRPPVFYEVDMSERSPQNFFASLESLIGELSAVSKTFSENRLWHQTTFTEEEAAEYLRCEVGTIRRYSLRTRQLKFSLIGRNRIYTKVHLDRLLAMLER